MKIKTPILIAIIVLVILVILAIVFGGYKKTPPPRQEEVVISKEIYGISGTIESIGQNSLSVNALILLEDASKAPITKKVDILVDADTKILALQFPNPEDIPEGSTEPIYPKETEIKFSDLKIGDKIDVQVTENISEKISNNASIIANTINVVR